MNNVEETVQIFTNIMNLLKVGHFQVQHAQYVLDAVEYLQNTIDTFNAQVNPVVMDVEAQPEPSESKPSPIEKPRKTKKVKV
jgi:hypothetical protein